MKIQDVDFYTLFPNALGQSIDSLKSEILLLKAEVTKIDRRFQMDSEQGMMWFTPPNANRVQVDFTKFGDPSDIELKRPVCFQWYIAKPMFPLLINANIF